MRRAPLAPVEPGVHSLVNPPKLQRAEIYVQAASSASEGQGRHRQPRRRAQTAPQAARRQRSRDQHFVLASNRRSGTQEVRGKTATPCAARSWEASLARRRARAQSRQPPTLKWRSEHSSQRQEGLTWGAHCSQQALALPRRSKAPATANATHRPPRRPARRRPPLPSACAAARQLVKMHSRCVPRATPIADLRTYGMH